MAFKLGKGSNAKLKGVDKRMVEIVKEAIKITEQDFSVICGLRTKKEQEELVARGASQTMKSKHLDGLAVDLMAYLPGNGDRWDQHNNLVDGHNRNCKTVDQPIAALITDLKRLGMLESTLVVWAGEFGRTPFAQGGNGRDHNPFGFTIWMAGGGIKGGATVGETDEWGYKAVQDRYEIHDLHATMLHLLGVDHTKSTFRFSGRDMRLTDVHGHLMKEILA